MTDPDLAAAIHEHYRAQARREGWDMEYDQPFEDLPEEIQHANLAAAGRIPRVLEAAELRIVSGDETPESLSSEAVREILEKNIETVAIAEHEGWMREKIEAGWRWGRQRSDSEKIHPSIIPYEELSAEEKEKDRSAVRNYPEIVRRAGKTILRSASAG